ncbi:MAG: amidase, partial [Caulobacteraceae bacterium]|nr:amidase [Caulobacteraceae bacterium]
LDLKAPRHARLADYRVLLLTAHPVAATDSRIAAALEGLASRLEGAGVKVARHADRLPDLAAAHQVYLTLLMTAMSRGAPPRPDPLTAHGWLDALDAQLAFRRQWAALFEDIDVIIAPAFGVVAFAHDDAPFAEREHVIDGAATPYPNQVAWPGMATLANLPATAVPIGATAEGLPIGAQIIGPYLEDRTTIAFAGLLEQAFGGFQRPGA